MTYPTTSDWPFVMAMLAEAAVVVGDREAAATLHAIDLLSRWNADVDEGRSCGPSARLLAKLEYALGWTDHADWHFNEAVESGRRLMSPVWTARCQLDWAWAWIGRGETVRAVQLIYAAEAEIDGLDVPALRCQSSILKHHLDPR